MIRDFKGDAKFVKSVSAKIDMRILREKISQETIDKLSVEELMDLNKIVNLADYMLCKYEENKKMKLLLQNFTTIIECTCNTVDGVDDEITEMLVSAENSINKMKNIHGNMSEQTNLVQIRGGSCSAKMDTVQN